MFIINSLAWWISTNDNWLYQKKKKKKLLAYKILNEQDVKMHTYFTISFYDQACVLVKKKKDFFFAWSFSSF